jgi:hypothetical protein
MMEKNEYQTYLFFLRELMLQKGYIDKCQLTDEDEQWCVKTTHDYLELIEEING